MATADRETTDREPEAPRGSSTPALPNARLNPLLNPLLAKQLGRWAHIYYTASVDKREAAIEKLVCELEAEAAKIAGNTATPVPREEHSQDAAAPRTTGPVLVAAQHTEPPPVAPPVIENVHTEDLVVAPPISASPGVESEEQTQAMPEPMPESPMPESWHELIRQHASSPPPEEPPPAPEFLSAEIVPKLASEPVLEKGRTAAEDYRSFDDLLARSDAAQLDMANVTPAPTRRWRVPLVAAGVLAVLGGSFWIASGHHARTAAIEQAHVPPKPVTPPVVAAEPPTPAKPAVSTAARTGVHEVLVSKNTPLVENTQATDPELAAGMRSLQGNGVERNSAEAARHLWQSVKNQNGSALVVLAGLYAQGDGVTKDCDQAKILLDAASKQAKSQSQTQRVETARETLRTSGCE